MFWSKHDDDRSVHSHHNSIVERNIPQKTEFNPTKKSSRRHGATDSTCPYTWNRTPTLLTADLPTTRYGLQNHLSASNKQKQQDWNFIFRKTRIGSLHNIDMTCRTCGWLQQHHNRGPWQKRKTTRAGPKARICYSLGIREGSCEIVTWKWDNQC